MDDIGNVMLNVVFGCVNVISGFVALIDDRGRDMIVHRDFDFPKGGVVLFDID